jgi:hypothetical protein
MIVLCFHRNQHKFNKKRAYKLNSKAQSKYIHVKIGFMILTTIVAKTALLYKTDCTIKYSRLPQNYFAAG